MEQQSQTQHSQPQYVARTSHAGRNLAILFVLGIIFFAVPFVNVETVNIGIANASVTGSLSYAIFHCGEVHLSGSTFGSTIDRYEWVCGNQSP